MLGSIRDASGRLISPFHLFSSKNNGMEFGRNGTHHLFSYLFSILNLTLSFHILNRKSYACMRHTKPLDEGKKERREKVNIIFAVATNDKRLERKGDGNEKEFPADACSISSHADPGSLLFCCCNSRRQAKQEREKDRRSCVHHYVCSNLI